MKEKIRMFLMNRKIFSGKLTKWKLCYLIICCGVLIFIGAIIIKCAIQALKSENHPEQNVALSPAPTFVSSPELISKLTKPQEDCLPADFFDYKFRFEDYAVNEVPLLDLNSHPRAMEFRTSLREGVKEGPNFAGHYTIVTISCGTNCQTVWVVDTQNGKAYLAPFVAELGIEFKKSSNLLMENPPNAVRYTLESWHLDCVQEWMSPNYYLWTGNKFVLLNNNYSFNDDGSPGWLGGTKCIKCIKSE